MSNTYDEILWIIQLSVAVAISDIQIVGIQYFKMNHVLRKELGRLIEANFRN